MEYTRHKPFRSLLDFVKHRIELHKASKPRTKEQLAMYNFKRSPPKSTMDLSDSDDKTAVITLAKALDHKKIAKFMKKYPSGDADLYFQTLDRRNMRVTTSKLNPSDPSGPRIMHEGTLYSFAGSEFGKKMTKAVTDVIAEKIKQYKDLDESLAASKGPQHEPQQLQQLEQLEQQQQQPQPQPQQQMQMQMLMLMQTQMLQQQQYQLQQLQLQLQQQQQQQQLPQRDTFRNQYYDRSTPVNRDFLPPQVAQIPLVPRDQGSVFSQERPQNTALTPATPELAHGQNVSR